MRKLLLFFSLIFLIAEDSKADFFDFSDPNDGVVVETKENVFLPYTKRRKPLGILFSVQMENYQPNDYMSILLNGKFKDLTGEATVPVYTGELGLKYNFAIGSVAALVSYGKGVYADPIAGITNFDVSLMKVDANFTLDAIMEEPFVAPYVQGGMHKFEITEETDDGTNIGSESPATSWNFHYRAGLLFQLNWIEKAIDPNSHVAGLRSSGLQNTYVDVFYASYASPGNVASAEGQEGEPDTASTHYGVGLKMEF